jgi:type IV fimbrial biogenesis protein FimT
MNARGFSLVELMVAVALAGILLALGMPAFSLWVSNAKVRTAQDALQSGLRLAQAEAVRRHRQVVFFRTPDTSCGPSAAADADGPYWALRTAALTPGDDAQTIQCGQLAELADGVVLGGPAAVCFNGIGRQVAIADPGVGGIACTLPPDGNQQYNVSHPGGDRPLRVRVSLAGSVRTCDPARVFSVAEPDGCPP